MLPKLTQHSKHQLPNPVVAEAGNSTLLIPKPTTEHNPELVPSNV
jgi:hypothetical protein